LNYRSVFEPAPVYNLARRYFADSVIGSNRLVNATPWSSWYNPVPPSGYRKGYTSRRRYSAAYSSGWPYKNKNWGLFYSRYRRRFRKRRYYRRY